VDARILVVEDDLTVAEVVVAARRARSDGRVLDLTVREFDLLAFFVCC
jgi:DNA-binding response OmpR family regulator